MGMELGKGGGGGVNQCGCKCEWEQCSRLAAQED